MRLIKIELITKSPLHMGICSKQRAGIILPILQPWRQGRTLKEWLTDIHPAG